MQKPYSISNNQEMTLEQILKFIEERKQANDRHPACYCSGGQFIQKAEKTANQGTTAKTPGYLWAREKPGSGEPNAQPRMAPSATTVITSKRCVESRTTQKRPNTEMQSIFDTLCGDNYAPGPPHLWQYHILRRQSKPQPERRNHPKKSKTAIVCHRLSAVGRTQNCEETGTYTQRISFPSMLAPALLECVWLVLQLERPRWCKCSIIHSN